MPNKFTQSVLERQYQEERKRKRTETQTQPEEANEKQEICSPSKGEEAPSLFPQAEALPDIDSFLIREEARVAKNKTFYLDQSVIDAVRAAAKRQKVTDSKLVNDILRGVLRL